MELGRPRKDAAWPWLLFLLWILGTPLLGVLWFSYGFALMGGVPRNRQLCGNAMLIVGLGAPVVGLLLALVSRRRSATIVFGLALLTVAALWAWLVLRK
ncbi:hypothetical protein [Nonomuraea sp. NPDC049784]|uniref:hypothetical protein n=1 Tax=Nonomuraea sp. NPDC049784 TaxID=3154361 RepID=UPI0033E9CFE8